MLWPERDTTPHNVFHLNLKANATFLGRHWTGFWRLESHYVQRKNVHLIKTGRRNNRWVTISMSSSFKTYWLHSALQSLIRWTTMYWAYSRWSSIPAQENIINLWSIELMSKIDKKYLMRAFQRFKRGTAVAIDANGDFIEFVYQEMSQDYICQCIRK